jgi:predicted RNase H-like nuclease (RuvC/YqgF family)
MSESRFFDESHLPSPAARQYAAFMEARVAVLEEIAKNTHKVLERLDSRMDQLDARMHRLDARMDQFDTRMNRIETRMDRVEDRQNSDFKWLMGFAIGSTGLLFATMAHGFYWF